MQRNMFCEVFYYLWYLALQLGSYVLNATNQEMNVYDSSFGEASMVPVARLRAPSSEILE